MQKRYLTEEEQRRLLAAARRTNDPLAQRDYHWMGALMLTGMRIAEFSRLTVPQVRLALQCGWLVSRKDDCKGKRRANEYLVTQPLQVHLAALVGLSDHQAPGMVLEPEQAQPLVWGRDIAGRCGALSVRSYEARLKDWGLLAGLDARFSPHWLRHTRAMNIMRRSRGNNPLKVCQQALNHASLQSTGIYLQMSREEYAADLAQVDAASGRVPKAAARQVFAQQREQERVQVQVQEQEQVREEVAHG